jgi:hypothetical protein
VAKLAGCAVLLSVAVSCSGSEGEAPDPAAASLCARGAGTPITVSALVSTLRRHGFEVLPDEGGCMKREDVATLSNVDSQKSDDEVEREDGHVICNVGKQVGEPFRPRTRLSRTKYPTDDETYVSVYNVSCAIYPAVSVTLARRQLDRLQAALGEFTRRCCVLSFEHRRATCGQGA